MNMCINAPYMLHNDLGTPVLQPFHLHGKYEVIEPHSFKCMYFTKSGKFSSMPVSSRKTFFGEENIKMR